MLELLITAFCMMLVFEGILPFLAPSRWRKLMVQIANMHDSQIRNMGLVSMLLGASLIYLMNL